MGDRGGGGFSLLMEMTHGCRSHTSALCLSFAFTSKSLTLLPSSSSAVPLYNVN